MNNAAPGYAKHPNHVVAITPVAGAVKVAIEGEEVARTETALLVEETGYVPIIYIHRDALHASLLTESDHTSYCPFKGQASYFHLSLDGKTHDNAVWAYSDPYDDALALKDYVAIYASVAMVSNV